MAKKKSTTNKDIVNLVSSLNESFSILIDCRKMRLKDFFKKYQGIDVAMCVDSAERDMEQLKKVVSRRIGNGHSMKDNFKICPNCGHDLSVSILEKIPIQDQIFEEN